jgi:predicted ferric reductase
VTESPSESLDHQALSSYVVNAGWFGALFVAVWPVVLALATPAPLLLVPVIAHVSGMLAGYGVLVLMTLMSRWPLLERGVGGDRLARWHAMTGRAVVTLVVVHACAAVTGWAQARGESIPLALWDVLGMPWLISATLGTIAMLAVAAISIRAARKRLRYETWHAIHLWTYVAIALSFVHQLAGPDLTGHRWLQVAWALLYAHTFGLVLRYRILAPVRQAARHRLRVSAVVPEAPGVVSIVITGHRVEELHAEPGQFFRWRFLTPDTWLTAHPFSLSEPPRADRLRLTVKDLGDGSGLLQHIEVGTWVVAEGPYGAMTAARRTRRNVLLVAGGVGITPMRALFETIPAVGGDDQDLLLLYRARTREDIVFRAELDEIAARRRARVVYLLGNNRDHLSTASLTRLVPDLVSRDVYLCGPPGMAAAVRASVLKAGLPAGHLHEERFAF